eukprot:gene3967-4341_t
MVISVRLILWWTCLFLFLSLISSHYPDYHLLQAAEKGNAEDLLRVIQVEHPNLSARNNYGVSALIFAANNGHLECVKILLDHGVNINERSNNGKTAVHWATHWGHDTIVHYLLEQGANLTIPDKDGMTVLMTAVLSGKAALVSLLLKSGVPLAITAVNIHNGNALSIAEAKGNQEIIDMLRPYFPAPPQEVSPYWVVVEIFAEQTKQLVYCLYKVFFNIIAAGQWKDAWKDL